MWWLSSCARYGGHGGVCGVACRCQQGLSQGCATRQVMEKEGPQPAESEESSIYSPAIPREKWQRRRTQVKIRVRAL